MIRILVTGSNGQLGQSITKIADKHVKMQFVFETSSTFDITDTSVTERKFSAGHFDYCINCAAYTNVEQAERTPERAYAVNAEGVKNLALACRKNKVTLIHISTDYVFDGEKVEGYTVHDIPNPINVYGASKLAGEREIQNILNDFFIIRTSWLYSEYGKNFYKTILQKSKTEQTLYVTDEQTGCPTHADNLADYILELIDSRNSNFGVFHYTDGKSMTWYDFAKTILQEHKIKVKLVRKSYPTIAKRPKSSVLLFSDE